MPKQEIILIDPAGDLRDALEKLLGRFEYRLHYAPTPQQAFQLLHKQPETALAIVSQAASGLSAVDTVKALRKWKHGCPAILLGADETTPAGKELAASGATAFLARPIHIGQLLLTINRILQENAQAPAAALQPLPPLECKVFFTIKNVSETGCCLSSHFPLERNHILVLESPELSLRLDLPPEHSFPMRICNCSQNEGSRIYSLGAQFIGMSETVKVRLHAACLSVKGFKFNGSSK